MKRMIFVALALNVALLGVIAHQLVANAGDEPAVTRNGNWARVWDRVATRSSSPAR